ncbi:hypothetical protein CcCBS67573_g06984 [Chytriomyces confervae]|uniref:Dienelactone hydrolase domain-containing protein n=1 Tax=Chytriomyces confervae TaxID=246404 RepID=A0A507EYG7_9FUNG|nr:hypothetical protein HDU80_007442 [Chytriomyces hyalinus]TPX68981.1 hypothetical protein CcCBS67573_g06984 [Chytriomyces confervae]
MFIPSPLCCSGSIDAGTPTGRVEVIGDMECYVREPDAGVVVTGAVVVCTDVFGFKVPNVRLIADVFAANGFVAVVPDYLQRAAVRAELLDAECIVHDREATIWQRFQAAMLILWCMPSLLLLMFMRPQLATAKRVNTLANQVRTRWGVTHVGLQGYCYGGGVGILLSQQQDCHLDAFSVAHPGGLFRIPADFLKIVKPIHVVLAETDLQIGPKQRNEMIDALEQVDSLLEGGLLSKVEWFDGVRHGFAVRGNEQVAHVKQQREAALTSSIRFLNAAFSKKSSL